MSFSYRCRYVWHQKVLTTSHAADCSERTMLSLWLLRFYLHLQLAPELTQDCVEPFPRQLQLPFVPGD